MGSVHMAMIADPTNPNAVYISGDTGPGGGNLFRALAPSTWTSLTNVDPDGAGPLR